MNFTVLERYPQISKKEIKNIKEKFTKANFPLGFINSVVAQFKNNTYNNNETNEEDKMIIPPQLFEIPKKTFFKKYHSVKQLKKDQKPFKINFTVSQMKHLN